MLDRYRSQLAPGDRFWSCRPSADAVHYRRELAEAGVVLGARVESFGGLMREIAGRAGLGPRPLGGGARERVVAAAIAEAPLELLAPSAAAPGFLAAATRLVGELASRRISPQRLTAALRSWAPDGRRRAYCDEVAAIYAGYRRRLERLGRRDEEQLASASLDAIRIDPSVWGRTPVMLYGFDDLDPLQLDAVETLARGSVDVVVSLPYEPGRVAFAGRAATFETLRPTRRGDHLPAAGGRATTRGTRGTRCTISSGPCTRRTASRSTAARRCGLLEGETERDELELVGAELLGLIEAGYRPEEIAVVMRSLSGSEDLIAEVFGGTGRADLDGPRRSLRRHRGRPRVARPAAGRARRRRGRRSARLAAGSRAARAPGAGRSLRGGCSAAAASIAGRTPRSAGSTSRWTRSGVCARRPSAVRRRCSSAQRRNWSGCVAAPWRRRAHVLAGEDLAQARVVGEAARRLAELRELTRADPSLGPTPAELISIARRRSSSSCRRRRAACSCATRCRCGRGGSGRCSSVASRRARSRRRSADGPFFSAEDRAEIARGLGSRARGVRGRRWRPSATSSTRRHPGREARLRLSWHRAGDDGAPTVASPFLDDVRDAFAPGLDAGDPGCGWGCRGARSRRARPTSAGCGHVGLGRLVLGGGARRACAGSRAVAVGARVVGACPVAWFVERLLGADAARAGGRAAGAGERRPRGARAGRSPSCAPTGPPGTADAGGGAARWSMGAGRARRRRCRATTSATGRRDAGWRPTSSATWSASRTGRGGTCRQSSSWPSACRGPSHPEVALAGGELVLRGRIDRVDIDRAAGTAIVHDYKSRSRRAGAGEVGGARAMALALYMLVAGELLGVEVVGGPLPAAAGAGSAAAGSSARRTPSRGSPGSRPIESTPTQLAARQRRCARAGGAGGAGAAGGGARGAAADLLVARRLPLSVDLPQPARVACAGGHDGARGSRPWPGGAADRRAGGGGRAAAGGAAAGGERREREDDGPGRAFRPGRPRRRGLAGRGSWRSRSPSGRRASCASGFAGGCTSSAIGRRRGRPRRRSSRRSTASAPACCARTRSRRAWRRASRCSTRATAAGLRAGGLRAGAGRLDDRPGGARPGGGVRGRPPGRGDLRGLHDELRSRGMTRPRLPARRTAARPAAAAAGWSGGAAGASSPRELVRRGPPTRRTVAVAVGRSSQLGRAG